jgi:hypothetical protein
MIKLYHGGTEIIQHPEIREPNRTLDFGRGFYLTSSMEQAQDWIRRHFNNDQTCGYVNTYLFDPTDAECCIKILHFAEANEDWLDFVMKNRREPKYNHDYDIVIGPVANDRVYTSFALFEGGIIDKVTLIKELKTYRLVDQYLFHTERSLQFLKFETANKIEK